MKDKLINYYSLFCELLTDYGKMLDHSFQKEPKEYKKEYYMFSVKLLDAMKELDGYMYSLSQQTVVFDSRDDHEGARICNELLEKSVILREQLEDFLKSSDMLVRASSDSCVHDLKSLTEFTARKIRIMSASV